MCNESDSVPVVSERSQGHTVHLPAKRPRIGKRLTDRGTDRASPAPSGRRSSSDQPCCKDTLRPGEIATFCDITQRHTIYTVTRSQLPSHTDTAIIAIVSNES